MKRNYNYLFEVTGALLQEGPTFIRGDLLMNEKQELLYQNLKSIKDVWRESAVDSLNPNTDLIAWTDVEESLKIMQQKLSSREELEAYRKVVNNVIEGVMHSILVMIDGGDELADKFLVDLIDRDTKESLQEDIALHEEFYGYLLDKEEV